MKTLTPLKTIAAASLAFATVSIPTIAQAGEKRSYVSHSSYSNAGQDCRADENEARLIGGLLGAVIGGVVGSQVSGNGARTEGSAVGAVIGGLAGSGIGDESVDCDKRRYNSYGTRTTYTSGYQTAGYNTGYNSGYNNSGYSTAYYPNSHNGYTRPNYNYGHDRKLAKELREVQNAIDDVSRRLRELRYEDKQLQRKLRHHRDRRLQKRHDWVCDEIRRLDKKLARLNKEKHKLLRKYRH